VISPIGMPGGKYDVNFFDSISPKGYDFRLVANPALLTAFTNLGHEANMGAMP